MPEKFLLKNGFSESSVVKKIIEPYKKAVAGEIYAADDNSFNVSADYLINTFKEYSKVPAYKRAALLSLISDEVKKQKEELAQLITKETGKPIKFSRIEIDRAVLTFRLGAEESTRINGEILPLDLLPGSEDKLCLVKRYPIGLILGITPWNFPVNLAAHKVSPALASGNVIMIKPSSNAMLTGLELGRIIHKSCSEAGFDFCPVNVLTLSGSALDKHVTDDRINMISFTGSSAIGWKLKSRAYKQRVSLELGGNAGVIIDEIKDMDNVISKLIMGGFSAAGQSCISVQRIYVNDNIYNNFRDKLTDAVKNIIYGDPNDENTTTGPMITEEEAMRAEDWINEAKNAGAEVLCGGARSGAVLAPTVIENANDNLKVKCNEVFAPVVTIEKYSNFEEAVDKINNSVFGLQAGVFSNDMRKIMYAFNNIHTGGVIINEVSAYRMDSMPYGGVKESGNSKEGVKWAIQEMTEEKILVM